MPNSSRVTKFANAFVHHRHVEVWLFFYAIVESVLFPIPPDVILIALALARPKHAQRFAFITVVGSVIGGLVGYAIGRYAFQPVAEPILMLFCTTPTSLACPDVFVPKLENLFAIHGPWVVGISAMSAIIPYKFTILAAGLAKMALLPFITISFAVHWFRYALISFLVAHYGQKVMHLVRDQMPLFFTIAAGLVLVIYAAFRYF